MPGPLKTKLNYPITKLLNYQFFLRVSVVSF
jgi:hypothetical protein